MGSSRHSCNCSDCVESRIARQELQHGGTDWTLDDEELLPYRKGSRSNWRNRRTRACKKSKTGEACVYDATKVVGTKAVYSLKEKKHVGNQPKTIKVCSRCGKHDPGQYTWSFYD